MSQWKQNIIRHVNKQARIAAERIGENYVKATKTVLREDREWGMFAGSRTVRKNPNAPHPVVEGSLRDTRDTDELYDSVRYELEPGNKKIAVNVIVERRRLEYVLAYRPELWDYVLEEQHLATAYQR